MRPPFEIGGQRVTAGEARRVEMPFARLVTQTPLSLLATVIHGTREGPRLWLSAAIHGDELNGTEIIRRVLEKLSPRRLRGTVVAVPVVNVFGFLNQSRYLPDRRDLNRSFPGSARGSLAGRLAHLFMTEVVARCTHGVDLHTGSNNRTNLPQIRANLDRKDVKKMARAFAAPLLVHADSRIQGTLRTAADRYGIPIIVYEGGEPLRFDETSVAVGVRGVRRVMQELKMVAVPKKRVTRRSLVSRSTRWVRAPCSGLVHLTVGLRDHARKGDEVAVMRDSFGDVVGRVKAPCGGLVMGMTTNPLVHRGEAILHIAELTPHTRSR